MMISEIFHEASIVIILGIIIWNLICKFIFAIIRQDNALSNIKREISLMLTMFFGGLGMGSAQKYVTHKKAPLNSVDFKVAKWIGVSTSVIVVGAIIGRWGNMFINFYNQTIAPNMGGFIAFLLLLGGIPFIFFILFFSTVTNRH